MESFPNEKQTLLGNTRGLDEKKDNGDCDDDDEEEEEEEDREFVPLKDKTWSFSHGRRHVATTGTHEESYSKSPVVTKLRSSGVDGGVIGENTNSNKLQTIKKKGGQHYIFCLIYAIVNVVIAVPGLFGYAAVIFNHPIYSNHMNALSKCKSSSYFITIFIFLT
jgi:hypothetical protein